LKENNLSGWKQTIRQEALDDGLLMQAAKFKKLNSKAKFKNLNSKI
jgi:hypothetical protein